MKRIRRCILQLKTPTRSIGGLCAQKTLRLRLFSCLAQRANVTPMCGSVSRKWISLVRFNVSSRWKFFRMQNCVVTQHTERAATENDCHRQMSPDVWRRSRRLTLSSLLGQRSAICRRNLVLYIQVTPLKQTNNLYHCIPSFLSALPYMWCYILCICSVQHSQQTIQTLSVLQNHSEHGSPERVLKRPRLCLTAGCTAVVVDQPASAQGDVERTSRNLLQPRSSHLSRTRRLKQLNASGLIKNSEGQSDKTMTDPQKGKWGPMTLFFSTTFWHFFPPMILKGLFVLLI